MIGANFSATCPRTAILDRFLHHADLLELKGQKLSPESSFSSERRAEPEPEGDPTPRQTRHQGWGAQRVKTSRAKGASMIQNQPPPTGRPARPAKTKSLEPEFY